ncbi:hypothetical protein HAX54_047086, partial [Datura stramonium]|nr:hypothetical protein [Datura stramonium]
GMFILPVYFIILDYEDDEAVPNILGRGLLAMVYIVIRVKSGKMSMIVDEPEVVFYMLKIAGPPPIMRN